MSRDQERFSQSSSSEAPEGELSAGPSWKITFAVILGFVTVVGGLILVKYLMYDNTVKTAERNGMEQAIVNELRVYDPLALTPEGVIHSYEIDYQELQTGTFPRVKVYVNGDKNLYLRGILDWGRLRVDDKHYKKYLYYESAPSDGLNFVIAQRYGFDPKYGEVEQTEEYKRLEAEWRKGLDEIKRKMPGEVVER